MLPVRTTPWQHLRHEDEGVLRAGHDDVLTRPEGTTGRRRLLVSLLRAVVVAVLSFTLYFTLPFDKASAFNTGVALLIGLVLVTILLAWQARQIAHDPHPRARAVEALVTSFPIAVLVFATTYFLMSEGSPESFNQPLSRVDSLYFTVSTFATVGFGDVAAVTEAARIIVTIQIVVDLILVGLVVRVFLSSVQSGLERQASAESAEAAVEESDPPTQGSTDAAAGSAANHDET
jgi:voltage-gated potassium channel